MNMLLVIIVVLLIILGGVYYMYHKNKNITFTGSGYMQIQNPPNFDTTNLTLEMEIHTLHDGLIFYADKKDVPKSSLSLYIKNGYVHANRKDHDINIGIKITDNKPHKIRLVTTTKVMMLFVDDKKFTQHDHIAKSEDTLPYRIFFGGLVVFQTAFFQGCLINLLINNKSYKTYDYHFYGDAYVGCKKYYKYIYDILHPFSKGAQKFHYKSLFHNE